MADNTKYWGQGANTNNNGYGSGANNDIGWGSVHANSYGHDETDLLGVPAIYVGNPDTPTGIGDPTNGTAQLLYRNRIEARPYWTTRQNLYKYSEDFSNAAWLKVRTGVASIPVVTANAGIAPDGTTTADRVQFDISVDASANRSLLRQGYTALDGTNHTHSFWVKSFDGTTQYIYPHFGGSGGEIEVTNEWTEIEFQGTSTSEILSGLELIGGKPSGATTSDILIWGAQLNEGTTADEYVKTEGEPYSFAGDETQLNDYSGSNNGGQIHSGGALSFTTNDYVTVGDIAIGSGLSVFAYASTTSVKASIVTIAAKYNQSASEISYAIGLASGIIRVIISQNGGLATNYKVYETVDTFNDGELRLIGFTFESNVLTIYVDGVEVAVTKVSDFAVSSIFTSNQPNYIGRVESGAYFNGDISSYFHYNRALSASEVLYNYNNPQTPIQSGLVVNYGFDELAGTTLFDKSGNGNNGTIVGATWESGIKEGFQPALSGYNNYSVFNGTSVYVSALGTPFNGLTDFVFKANNVVLNDVSSVVIFDQRDAGTDGISIGVLSSGKVYMRLNTNLTTFDFSPVIGTQYDFRIEYDGVDTAELYVNDVLTDTQTNTYSAISTTQAATIGRISYSATEYVTGIIGSVEVEGVGRWSNLGGWVDEIGSNNGTENGTPSKARIFGSEYNSKTDVFLNPFNFNEYYKFDGVDDYVSIASNLLNSKTSFSIKSNFITNDLTTVQLLLDNRDLGTDGVAFRTTASGKMEVLLNGTSILSTTSLNLGLNEVVADWDGANLIFTINGVVESAQALTGTLSISSPVTLGRVSYAAAGYFNGIIDYVEIAGIGRWDNLNGFADSIGSNDGTINGSPAQVRKESVATGYTVDEFDNQTEKTTGFIANALNFSGGYSGLYVDAGANVDTSGAFSFAGWVYIKNTTNLNRIFNNTTGTNGVRLIWNTNGSVSFDSLVSTALTQVTSGTDLPANDWYFVVVSVSSSGVTNFYIGNKTTVPSLSGGANQAGGSRPSASDENMIITNISGGTRPLNGYLPPLAMYTEDLSSANTDLTKINQIWNATKSLIPS